MKAAMAESLLATILCIAFPSDNVPLVLFPTPAIPEAQEGCTSEPNEVPAWRAINQRINIRQRASENIFYRKNFELYLECNN